VQLPGLRGRLCGRRHELGASLSGGLNNDALYGDNGDDTLLG
jgi:hypothetical protein